MSRKLTPEEKKTLIDGYLANLHRAAIDHRYVGRFDAANYFAELAHQFEHGNFVVWGEMPGLESANTEELHRFYGKS